MLSIILVAVLKAVKIVLWIVLLSITLLFRILTFPFRDKEERKNE